MYNTPKIYSFDVARVVALVAVVLIHGQFFMDYAIVDGEPWLNYLMNQLCRFAVPLFFLMAGYLIFPSLSQKPFKKARSYCMPLMVIWALWSAIALVMPFNLGTLIQHGYLAERQGYWGFLASTPLNSLFEGGLVHLWYLPALVSAVIIIALFERLRVYALLLPVAIALYVYGVGAGSYAIITEWSAPIFTRNGPYFSLLMVSIGYAIRRNDWSLPASSARAIALLGLSMHFAEALFLHGKGQLFSMNDFLIGTAVWSAGLFFWLLAKPNLGQSPIWARLSQWVFPMYVTHLFVIIILFNVAGVLGLTQGAKDALVFIGTLLGSYLLVVAVDKTPMSFARLRLRFA
jgi:surface polysaccharide O-acyltransferase-like enzyme